MVGIANAGAPEGDYQGWDTHGKDEVIGGLEEKASELLERSEASRTPRRKA